MPFGSPLTTACVGFGLELSLNPVRTRVANELEALTSQRYPKMPDGSVTLLQDSVIGCVPLVGLFGVGAAGAAETGAAGTARHSSAKASTETMRTMND